MAGALDMERPTLYVEGEDDRHAIIHLLAAHGVELDITDGPVYVQATGSDSQLMKAIGIVAKAASTTMGFAVDIDTTAGRRWDAVCGKLKPRKLGLEAMPPAEGLIAGELGGQRIGVWLLPDNATDASALEDLLLNMVPPGDPILPYAAEATDHAGGLGAPFQPKYRRKAVMRTWLAWQAEPGIAYGLAIKAGWLQTDHENAIRFVTWFKTLFASHLVA